MRVVIGLVEFNPIPSKLSLPLQLLVPRHLLLPLLTFSQLPFSCDIYFSSLTPPLFILVPLLFHSRLSWIWTLGIPRGAVSRQSQSCRIILSLTSVDR